MESFEYADATQKRDGLRNSHANVFAHRQVWAENYTGTDSFVFYGYEWYDGNE